MGNAVGGRRDDAVQDRNGTWVSVGDQVDVGDPKPGDNYTQAFRGEVVSLSPEDGQFCVMGHECECFDVDADNVELAED